MYALIVKKRLLEFNRSKTKCAVGAWALARGGLGHALHTRTYLGPQGALDFDGAQDWAGI